MVYHASTRQLECKSELRAFSGNNFGAGGGEWWAQGFNVHPGHWEFPWFQMILLEEKLYLLD